MAQTLKFGNGTWATKKGSTLAFNDQDGNYKPLPFTTTRATSATRVNKEGLIEFVESDRPRIDYTDSADGVLLLEKAATNLVTYSESFDNSYWTKIGSSVTSGFLSPKGDLSAFKLIESSSGSGSIDHQIYPTSISVQNSTEYTIHHYIKSGENNIVGLQDVINGQYWATINLITGVVLDEKTSGNTKVTLMSNNFYKISIKFTSNTVNARLAIFLLPNTYQSGRPSDMDYVGDGTSGIYIYGAQLEAGSYATSYIPTQGSAVTRVADTASGAGNSEVFNDSSGVLFADISPLADDGTFRMIGIFDSQTGNVDRIQIYYRSDADKMSFLIEENNVNQFLKTLDVNTTQYNKCAFQYGNTSSVYINGFKLAEETGITIPNNLQRLSFNEQNGGNDFYGKTKEIAYYNTVLTDLELETLTSYRSLSELVTELNLNTL